MMAQVKEQRNKIELEEQTMAVEQRTFFGNGTCGRNIQNTL